jgi:hypothetical protein
MEFDHNGRPSRDTLYIAGIDVAAGTTDTLGRGASNSVIAFCDWQTGELAAEYVTHGVMPQDLARLAIAAGYWFEGEDFRPAKMIPERNGPGGEVVEAVKRSGYDNLYRDTADRSPEVKYGWHKDGRGETALCAFALHQQMLCEGKFVERSVDCVDEMRHYQRNPNGRGAPIHSASLMTEDPSGARENHGDRTITRVVICQVLQTPYDENPLRGQAPSRSYRAAKELEERFADEELLV